MNHKKIHHIGTVILVTLWACLTIALWFGPRNDISESERRPLAQMPEMKLETVLNGKFMSAFEDFSLDQFPFRDTFRKLKAGFHYYVLGQQDNNGIVLEDGSAVKLEMALNETSVNSALKKFQNIYDSHLTDSTVYMAVVPDKGYYLEGYPTMDYEALFAKVETGMPYATHIDLTDTLHLESYYRTDSHWRQEVILDAAQRLCDALGVTLADYALTQLERPFYGVYYGQAALPMEADTICLLENEVLDACVVTNYETGKTGSVYDMTKLESKDLYDVFLSGATALLTVENPNSTTDKELVVFRDSFGSAMVPLLLQDYATVTIIDIRYVASAALGQLVDFHGQDVLFLYSTTLLNNSSTLK